MSRCNIIYTIMLTTFVTVSLEMMPNINVRTDRWMSYLPNHVKNKPINHIILPGTHDSGANKINHTAIGNNFWVSVANKLSSLHKIKKIINDWTLTQNITIREQLTLGVRRFDFRISHCDIVNDFFVMHTFACQPLLNILMDIKIFIDNNPTEVIILNFSVDWYNSNSMNTTKNNKVVSMLNKIFGDKILARNNIFPSYNTMIDNGKQLIIFYNAIFNLDSNLVWNNRLLYEPWDDTSDIVTKIGMLDNDMNMLRTDKYNIISLTLTPQKFDICSDIIKRIFNPSYEAKSIEYYASIINSFHKVFVELNWHKLNNVSCLSFDFIEKSLIKNIIKLNFVSSN